MVLIRRQTKCYTVSSSTQASKRLNHALIWKWSLWTKSEREDSQRVFMLKLLRYGKGLSLLCSKCSLELIFLWKNNDMLHIGANNWTQSRRKLFIHKNVDKKHINEGRLSLILCRNMKTKSHIQNINNRNNIGAGYQPRLLWIKAIRWWGEVIQARKIPFEVVRKSRSCNRRFLVATVLHKTSVHANWNKDNVT